MIRRIIVTLGIAVLAVGIISGCGKGNKTDTPPPMSESEVALTKDLTDALRQYYFTRRNVPTNFDEFVSAAGLTKVPEPPAGKKFAIDRRQLQVIVVNR